MTITGSRPRIQKPSVLGFFATFGYAWFVIGLFTGTLVLVVAVRGILGVLQKLGWGQSAQNRLLMLVILLFVIGSFMLARRVVRVLYRQAPTFRKVALALLAIPALLSGYAWSNPTRFLSGLAGTTSSTLTMAGGPHFIFGSYPDADRIRKLKEEGVTAIVSLQSPAVVVEISGIAEERKAAKSEGMQFIEAPMLPWVSDNTESLETIKQLALHGTGTYYVHCGLGRDRVNIAKRVIESVMPQAATRVAAANTLKEAISFERRTEPFEHGMPMKIMPGAWVVPSLNKAEFYGFILQGQPGHVVIAMNPADTAQAAWLATAERDLKQYAVAYTLIPYPSGKDTSTAKVVSAVRALKPPFTVIVPNTTFDVGDPKDPVARAIAKAYNVSVQPLPKKVQLTAGERPDLVAPPAPR